MGKLKIDWLGGHVMADWGGGMLWFSLFGFGVYVATYCWKCGHPHLTIEVIAP
jgi:hypothetical protein